MTDYAVTYQTEPTNALAAATTAYIPICSVYSGAQNATEANCQQKWPYADTFSKLRVYVSANTANFANTVTFRNNGADGNQTVSITASTTGWFEDTTNSDTIAADDLINWKIVGAAGTGTATCRGINVKCVTATNGRVWIGGFAPATSSLATASVTRYIQGQGLHNYSASLTTTGSAYLARACTAKKMRLYVISNGRITDTVYTMQKNGSDVTQAVTVGSGGTGWFEDTSNTDSFAAGDYVSYKCVTSTGTGTIVTASLGAFFEDASGSYNTTVGLSFTQATNTTRFHDIFGQDSTALSTGAQAETKMRGSGTIRNVGMYASSNTSDQTTTFTMRKNGADTAVTFTIAATTTGAFSDASNSFTYADGDTVCLKSVRAAGGANTITLTRTFAEIVPDAEAASFLPAWARNSNIILGVHRQ